MNGEIGKTEVEIGLDEEGAYFEAGSREAAYAFIALLLSGSEEVIAYVETHIVSYEEVEVEMAEATETESGRGICTNRVELIHMITNLIESSDVTLIEDRDDMSLLAIHIVDGLEDEADRIEMRKMGISSDKILLVCPECAASQEKPAFWSELADQALITCMACEHVGAIGDFRTAAAGDGGEE